MKSEVVIYHNPRCGTSRNTLELLKQAGFEPQVVEYLKTPPTRQALADVIKRMGVPVRDVVRTKEALYKELKLDDPKVTDAQLLDAMVEHPILINRPIVITARGAVLCRPPERVRELLQK
jgi:arsenate reductase